MTGTFDEEPWEAEIGSLLAALPMVDPPAGFIESALDHRPLHAGRILTGLVAASLAAVVAVVATGAVGRSEVAIQIDDLTRRHETAVRAGVLSAPVGEVEYRVETPVELPPGYQRTRNLAVEDLRQALYARGDDSVSVFVQAGTLSWESLPPEGIRAIEGHRAWVDPERRVTVIETSEEIVTIVGLPSDELAEVLAGLPSAEPSFWQRLDDTVDAIVGQLGYPSTG